MKKEEEERETYTEESGKTSKMKELKPAKKKGTTLVLLYSTTAILVGLDENNPLD